MTRIRNSGPPATTGLKKTEHTYPSRHLPGSHWATDEAWDILDRFNPGVIPEDYRAFLAGMIAGTLLKYSNIKNENKMLLEALKRIRDERFEGAILSNATMHSIAERALAETPH